MQRRAALKRRRRFEEDFQRLSLSPRLKGLDVRSESHVFVTGSAPVCAQSGLLVFSAQRREKVKKSSYMTW